MHQNLPSIASSNFAAQCPSSRPSSPPKASPSPSYWPRSPPSSIGRRLQFFPAHFPTTTLLIALLCALLMAPSPCQCRPYWLMSGGGNDQFMGPSMANFNGAANRHRRLFRLAEFVGEPPMPSSIYANGGQQQNSAKRQMKDSTASLSGFAKMDALKNNMMRALINLRRYRRAENSGEENANNQQ